MDPIKYIFKKPAVTSRIARWKMLLTEYDIQYVTQKAIKGSVLSDYLAHLHVEGYQPLRFDFPEEDIMFIRDFTIPGSEISPEEGPELGLRWTLVFNGASNARGHGIGDVINSPTGFHLPFTTRLCFGYTNNMAEYEACIYGLEAAIDLRIKILKVYGDSALVISQVKGDWETRDSKLIPYKEHIRKPISYFDEISFHHIPREENQLADALATLASMFKVKWKNEAPSYHIDHLDEPAHCLAIEVDPNDKPWFYDINTFLENRQFPEGISITDKKALRKLSSKFFLNGDVLYKRNYDFVLLRCMDRHEASTIIKSIHEGYEGVHAKGPAMAKKILRDGYYWTTMEIECYKMEVVLPIEVEIPSLRVIMEADLDEAEWVQSRYDQLNLIEEKRLTAVCHGQL
ncbi:uncharacterized protein LOC127094584 [Lathyrus oleraceus]|uniref:uncharacterized protein LOC127094584 n=1 Tax=Pisum sativum TaxID=3888 RepID=UPI0021CF2858|nr:uncharacterized protein LOC127094584 [Pisum sativum]